MYLDFPLDIEFPKEKHTQNILDRNINQTT